MPSPGEFVLEARGLSKTFTSGRWWQKQFRHRALDHVSLSLERGKMLAVIGESGSGKTTLAMCLVGLERPDAGEVLLDGLSIASLDRRSRVSLRKEMQLIFQDSSAALNPRLSAIEIVEEPLLIGGYGIRKERRELAMAMMERVGVSPQWAQRRPHDFSGGQRQRLAIARALTLRPKVLILDEIFVGLDLSIQGQIANLLLDLQSSHGLSYICISHDIALATQIADRIVVMDKGRIVEQMTTSTLPPDAAVSNSEWNSELRQSAKKAYVGA
ncbi:MAG TPA: dipeptide/oligopeptide/nickel ABC transporter ATP-binding protein [Candidatus Sulfotelmatobacter sp.]